jgi:hypothetical protein
MIFLLIYLYPLFFCIHLNWHRACLCVLATMRCRTRSTNERHIYIGKERMTASFVVHHVERILFLSVFFSRFLVLLLMLMRFLSLPDISSSNSNRPTLTYKREKVPTHIQIYILTQRLGHALIYNIQKMTQSCRLPTKGLDMQNLDTTHSDDRQLN